MSPVAWTHFFYYGPACRAVYIAFKRPVLVYKDPFGIYIYK